MPLTLKIVSYQRLTPGQEASFNINSGRVCIGRSQDNDWTLPDPQRFMSGTHCWVEERNGAWHLTDTSTNGTFLNGSEDRVEKNQSVKLESGDRIRLGDYELEVSLNGDAQADTRGPAELPDDEADIFAQPAPRDTDRSQTHGKEANVPLSQLDQGMIGSGVSIDELYGLEEADDEPEPPNLARTAGRSSPLDDHFSPPRVESESSDELPEKYQAKSEIRPEDWDDWDTDTGQVESRSKSEEQGPAEPPDGPITSAAADALASTDDIEPRPEPERPAVKPAMPPEEQPAAGPGGTQISGRSRLALEAFARGCGLDAAQLPSADHAALFESVGALLRAMTEGVMQAIASRGQVKSEFRLEQTMIAPTRNNPLKFSASAEEALMRLLSPADSAYLAGATAATEAIDDINAHQLAVLAGTEAALKSLLRRFKPAALEAKFGEASALGKAVPLIRKAKYWDFYKLLYDEISEATDDDFQKFFGSEFSRAYEEQLERLVKSRRESDK